MSGADDLRAFATDLGKVAGKAIPDIEPVLKKGANSIKEDLVSGARASKHFKGMAGSISYDSKGLLNYEIGPDKARRGGALGNIAYFGTSRGGGTLDLEGPLGREAPNLEREIGKAVDKWGDILDG